jgi:acetyl-CoA carboxylase carboxyltransferase component
MLHGIPVALAVMEFGFMGGSMGSVVGEKLTRLIEYATQEGLTLMVVCTSGGARMQVGGGCLTAAMVQCSTVQYKSIVQYRAARRRMHAAGGGCHGFECYAHKLSSSKQAPPAPGIESRGISGCPE